MTDQSTTSPKPMHKRWRFWISAATIATNVALVATGAIDMQEGLKNASEALMYLIGSTSAAAYGIAHARGAAETDRRLAANATKLEEMEATTQRALNVWAQGENGND